jgi:hypothetical protein
LVEIYPNDKVDVDFFLSMGVILWLTDTKKQLR